MNRLYKVLLGCFILLYANFWSNCCAEICSICQSELGESPDATWDVQQSSIIDLPCTGHHKFHAKCFCDYLQMYLKATKHQLNMAGTPCPLCRTPLTAELLIKCGREQLFCTLADLCPELTHRAHREDPLSIAVRNNRPAIVAKILEKNKQVKKEAIIHALFFASQRGLCDVIEALMRHRAFNDIIRDHYEFSPLYYAVTGRHYASVKKLLDVGAPLDERYAHWCYTMQCCVGTAWCGLQRQYADVVFVVPKMSDLDYAAYDWITQEDFSLLHLAYAMADLTMVNLLLSYHVDIKGVTHNGTLPIHLLAPVHILVNQNFVNPDLAPTFLTCGHVCRPFDIMKHVARKMGNYPKISSHSFVRNCLHEYFSVMPELVDLIGDYKSRSDNFGQRAYDYAFECYSKASSFSPEALYYKTLMRELKC